MKQLDTLLEPLLPELIALRHDLHANPELGLQEHATAGRIVEELRRIPGLSWQQGIAGTGILALLGAEKPGPCIALRADMDALPLAEETGLPYASRRQGVAHACGHDGHVTCLIGAARVLAGLAEHLPGPVKFIFQPAEEGDGGGRLMCEQGALDAPPVAAAFALHAWPSLPVGSIGVRAGPVMASTDTLEIRVLGRGTHAASPHLGVDPIVAASHIVTALQCVVSRRLPPHEAAAVTIARISGGTTHNVIPEVVELCGTIRTLSERARREAARAVRQIAEQTAQAHGATAEVRILDGYPVLVNNPDLVSFVRDVAARELGADAVHEVPVSLGGEDFSYYAQRVPAVMWRLGIRPPDAAGLVPLHSPRFDFTDDAIAVGVRLHCALALRFRR